MKMEIHSNDSEVWHAQLKRWKDLGVFDRLSKAHENQTPLLIRRSSGDLEEATISQWGYGGRAFEMRLSNGLFKTVRTSDLINDNPQLISSVLIDFSSMSTDDINVLADLLESMGKIKEATVLRNSIFLR